MHRLQPEDQVPRFPGDGLELRRLGAGHRSLCAGAGRAPADWELHRAADTERDQSYFLFATTREQLAFLRFPLGALHKDATRKLARDFGLEVAEKSDSQDICFVPTGRYTEVIERLRPGAAEAGNIVHVDGRVLGRHGGIINYTIGQRKGIGVPAQQPLYVLRLDASAREVVVGPREALRTRRLKLRDMNWLGDELYEAFAAKGEEILARIRSSGPLQPARLSIEEDGFTVELAHGEGRASLGQACVFYAAGGGGERLLGGGWIKSTSRDANLAPDGFAVPAVNSGTEKTLAAVSR